MARIRVRFELNKGRTGAPLAKLGKIAEQAERFLKALAQEAQIDNRAGEWLAQNFKNSPVSYDVEFHGQISDAQAQIFNRHLEFVVDFDPDAEGANGMVSEATMAEFAGLGRLIDPDEVIGLGIYNGSEKPKWRRISYAKTARIRQQIESPLPAHGALQGIIHSLQKEAVRPNFQLRELATDSLVRCFYTSSQYQKVVSVLKQRTAVVHVSGDITYDRRTRSAVEMRMERIEEASVLASADFEALFGAAPRFTGDMSTEEYIAFVRGDG